MEEERGSLLVRRLCSLYDDDDDDVDDDVRSYDDADAVTKKYTRDCKLFTDGNVTMWG